MNDPGMGVFDYTGRQQRTALANREKFSGAQNDRIDALDIRIDRIEEQIDELKELLQLAVRNGLLT
jgi:hypothetical protein